MSGEKNKNSDVEAIQSVIAEHPEVIVEIATDTQLSRIQPTRHKNPLYYNENSISRFGDLHKEIGVCYVAGSSEVAIAETFQHGADGPDSPVLLTEIQERSLHQLKAARPLRVIDVARAAAFGGHKLRHLVEAKGQGSEGYLLPQTLSAAIMRDKGNFDGLLYISTVFPAAASMEGCNLALFGGRETQLIAESSKPLLEVELDSGKTAVEFLVELKVSVE
ncbi:RES family NAD+ phosphorylase [Pseudomonas sp. H2_D02]